VLAVAVAAAVAVAVRRAVALMPTARPPLEVRGRREERAAD
jgi:hypothetical protein